MKMTRHPYRHALCGLALLSCTQAFGADVVRHKIPGSDFPIALAVEVPAGKKLVFLSGASPEVTDKSAKPGSVAAYGDTLAQTLSTTASEATFLRNSTLSTLSTLSIVPAAGGHLSVAFSRLANVGAQQERRRLAAESVRRIVFEVERDQVVAAFLGHIVARVVVRRDALPDRDDVERRDRRSGAQPPLP